MSTRVTIVNTEIGDHLVHAELTDPERNTWDECVKRRAKWGKGLPDSWAAVPRKVPPGRPRPPAAAKNVMNRNGDHLFPTQYDWDSLKLAGRRRRHGPLRQLQHALHVGRFRDRRYGEDLHAHRQRLPVAYSHHAPECRRNGLRRLRRNPETGRRVRHGQRPLPHHGRTPTATQARPIIDPDAGYSESGFSKFKHPIYGDELETFKMYQNRERAFYVNMFWSGMTWHGANKKNNSQRPVLFQRQFRVRENRTTIRRRVIWRISSPTRRSTPPPATMATWISPYSAMRRSCSTTSRRLTSTIRRMRTSRST